MQNSAAGQDNITLYNVYYHLTILFHTFWIYWKFQNKKTCEIEYQSSLNPGRDKQNGIVKESLTHSKIQQSTIQVV